MSENLLISLVIGGVLLAIILVFGLNKKKKPTPSQPCEIPGPKSTDISQDIVKAGSFKNYVEQVHDEFDSDLVQFWLNKEHQVVSVRDPAVVSKLLKIGSRPRFLFKFLEGVLGEENFQVMDGENAKECRKMFNQGLTHKALCMNYETMMKEVNEKLKKFREMKTFSYQMQDEMLDLSLKIAVKTIVGKKVPIDDLFVFSEYREAFGNIMQLSLQQQYAKLNEEEQEVLQKSCEFIDNATADMIAHVEKSTPNDTKTLLDVLALENDPKTGEPFTKEMKSSHVKGYLMAAYHTSIVGLSWAIFALTQHKEVLKKAQMEIDNIVQHFPNSSCEYYPTLDLLGKMTYCEQVINESMRIFTPGLF